MAQQKSANVINRLNMDNTRAATILVAASRTAKSCPSKVSCFIVTTPHFVKPTAHAALLLPAHKLLILDPTVK